MRAAVASFAFVLLACGSSTSTPSIDAGTSNDAASDAGPCVAVSQEGTPCTPGERSCDRVDRCCASAMVCNSTTKTWKLEGLACLQCMSHPCGTKTCNGGEICIAHGGVTPECVPYPTACARSWTCACVMQNLPPSCSTANACTDDALPVRLSCP